MDPAALFDVCRLDRGTDLQRADERMAKIGKRERSDQRSFGGIVAVEGSCRAIPM